jgi:hypothetical protein
MPDAYLTDFRQSPPMPILLAQRATQACGVSFLATALLIRLSLDLCQILPYDGRVLRIGGVLKVLA